MESNVPNTEEETPSPQPTRKNPLRARLLKGFGAEMYGNLVTLLIQVGSIPVYFQFWGKQLYGEWVVLGAIAGYFVMADLGFSNAAGVEMTMRIAKGDKAGALKVFQSAWVTATLLACFFAVVFLTVIHFLPVQHLFKLEETTTGEAHLLMSLLVFQAFFALQRQLIDLGYRCDGNYAVGSMISNSKRLFDFLVAITCIFMGGKPVHVAAAYVIAEIISNVWMIRDVSRRSPWLKIGWQHFDKHIVRSLSVPALSFTGLALGHAISLNGMVTVVGLSVGAAEAGTFDVMRKLTRGISQLIGSITGTVQIELSTAFGAKNMDLARTLHRKASQLSLWVSLILSAFLLVAGPTIYQVWTRKAVQFDPVLFLIFLAVMVCNSMWSVSHVVSIAVNRHHQVAITFLSATGISLVLAMVLSRFLGIYGIAIALLIIDMIMITLIIPGSLRLVQDRLSSYLRTVVMPPLDLPQQVMRKFSRS